MSNTFPFTPDTEEVREQYTREQPPHIGTVSEKEAEFDRWLAAHDAQVRREAKAEGLREAAHRVPDNIFDPRRTHPQPLPRRPDQARRDR